MYYGSDKETWDKMKNIYEGYDKVKREKLQLYKGKFETLKMNEKENIVAYVLHVYEVVNSIKGLG
jgi:hypothetical protein